MKNFAVSPRAWKVSLFVHALMLQSALSGHAQETAPASKSNSVDKTVFPKAKGDERLLASASPSTLLEQRRASPPAPELAPDHALTPILQSTLAGIDRIDRKIKDYECVLVKRERLHGTLQTTQFIQAKIRQRPLSVYLKFLGPQKVKGRECLYVEGRDGGKMLAHEGRGLLSKLPSIKLDPLGALAMRDQRYAITEIGVRRLAVRLTDALKQDIQHEECEVKEFPDVKIEGRPAYCIQVTHPVPREYFSFHIGQVFVDKELEIPIRYAGYMWPKTPGGDPVLDEEYTYLKLKINNGFTDEDFDPENKKYNF